MNFWNDASNSKKAPKGPVFTIQTKTALKRAKSSNFGSLSLWNGEDSSADEYALNSQPELASQTEPHNIFSSRLKDKKNKREKSSGPKHTRKRKINLKKQIRKSVQKFNRLGRNQMFSRSKPVKKAAFKIGSLSVPKFSLEPADKGRKEEPCELDESVRTKKKYLNQQPKSPKKSMRKRLKDKLKIQTKKIKQKLKQNIFRKIAKIGDRPSKVRVKKPKLKCFIYDNAIVNRNPQTQEGVVLFRGGQVYFGKLGARNKPSGRGILFSNEGAFLCGDFSKGQLNGKALTNDRRLQAPNDPSLKVSNSGSN